MPEASPPATRRDRRNELLDAADRAVRAHGPAVTMDRIAAEAGITKPILYRHFDGKGGLYEALARRYVDEAAAAIGRGLGAATSPRQRIRVTIDALLQLLEEQPETYRFLMHRAVAERPEARAALDDFTHQLAGRLAEVLHAELGRAGLVTGSAEVVAHALIGMVQHAAEWWLAERTVARSELVETLVRFGWAGLSGLPPAAEGRPLP